MEQETTMYGCWRIENDVGGYLETKWAKLPVLAKGDTFDFTVGDAAKISLIKEVIRGRGARFSFKIVTELPEKALLQETVWK